MEKETEEENNSNEINLLDYIIIIAKHKIFIIAFTLSIALLTAIYSLFIPEVYKAETRLLPPGNPNKGSLSELSNMLGINSSSGGISDPYSIVEIIKSRTVNNKIIDRFNLMDIYGVTHREDAIRALSKSIEVKNERLSRMITISVFGGDPKLAADIANGIVDELKNLLQTLAFTEASRRRLFFEEKLKQAKENLIMSEEAMIAFQEKTGALKVEDQTRAVLESITHLRAQIAAKEVELKVMKTYSTLNNPDLQMSQEALKGLKHELKKIEEKHDTGSDLYLTSDILPVLGTDYVRKLRDLKFNETLFELMAKQYEIARIDEAKDPAIIQILDKAVPPKNRLRPERRRMVSVSLPVGFFISLSLAFFLEYIGRHRQLTGKYKEKAEILKHHLSFKKKKRSD